MADVRLFETQSPLFEVSNGRIRADEQLRRQSWSKKNRDLGSKRTPYSRAPATGIIFSNAASLMAGLHSVL